MNTTEPMCPVCHIGKLRARKITYTQVFEGRLIAIPNVAALMCDLCGEKILDNEVLTRLSGLLGQNRKYVDAAGQRHSRL